MSSFAPLRSRARLTAAIHAHEASADLHQTLTTVRLLADEILVSVPAGHDFSRVARAAGATVVIPSRCDDFALARNEILARANGDWVLWLEAGERISDQTSKRLADCVARPPEARIAYTMDIEIPPATPRASSERTTQIRLVAHRDHPRFEGRIRDSLSAALFADRITIEPVGGVIERGLYEHDAEYRQRLATLHLKIADAAARDAAVDTRTLIARAEALAVLGRHEESLAAFRQALDQVAPASSDQLEAYYGLLTALDAQPEPIPRQTSLCLKALEAFPLDAQLLCAMGSYMQAEGRLELAARSFDVAFRHGRIEPSVWHLTEIREVAAACRAIILQLLGQEQAAQAAIEEALAVFPNSIRLRRQLIQLHVKHGRRSDALAQVDRLTVDYPGREVLRTAVRGACLAAMQNYLVAESYLRTAYDSGCYDPICLRGYVQLLLATGRNDRARKLLAQWRSLEPDDAEPARWLAALEPASAAGDRAAGSPADQTHRRIDEASESLTPNLAAAQTASTEPLA
jgi:tetratricopeptide (TPR) repeat protein